MKRNELLNVGSHVFPIACVENGTRQRYQLPPLSWISGIEKPIEPECYPFHDDIETGAITHDEMRRHNDLHRRMLRRKLERGLFIDFGLIYIVPKGKLRKNVVGYAVSDRPVDIDTITDFTGEPIAVAHINEHYVSFSYLDWMYCGPLPFLHGDKSITTQFTAYKMA